QSPAHGWQRLLSGHGGRRDSAACRRAHSRLTERSGGGSPAVIEERGRVLSVEGNCLWIETVRRSACDSCQARNGCGQSVLQRLGLGARQGAIRVVDEAPVSHYRAGDEVVIGIEENAVVRGSVLVYLVPLLGLFAGALLAQSSGAAEPWIVFAAVSGLGAGFAVTGGLARRTQGARLGIFAGALLARSGGAAAPWVVSAAASGLGAGFAVTGWLARRTQGAPAFVPRLLGRAVDAPGVVSEIRVKE